jgi:hypothetical protein
VAPLGIFASSSVDPGNDKLIGILYNTNRGDQEVGFTNGVYPEFGVDLEQGGQFLLSGSNFDGFISASINYSNVNDLSDVFGETPIVQIGGKKVYTYTFFEHSGSLMSAAAASSSIYVKALEDQDYTNGILDAYSAASTPWVKSQNISGERYDLFRFVTLGHGQTYTTKFKVGDTVWIIFAQLICEANVKEVVIRENSIGYNMVQKGYRPVIYRGESTVYASESKAQKAVNEEKIDSLLERIKKFQKIIDINQEYIATLKSEIKTLQS